MASELSRKIAEAVESWFCRPLGNTDRAVLADLIDRAGVAELERDADAMRRELVERKDARWAWEDPMDRKLGDRSIDEVVESERALRRRIEAAVEASGSCSGEHPCCFAARRLRGEES